MFTGIVQATASVTKVVKKNDGLVLSIEKPKGWEIKTGDSIAMDGTCLTVARVNKADYLVELMPETLNKTYFSRNVPKKVNLERSLRLSDLLGGHLVSGHIDAVGVIRGINRVGASSVCKIKYPKKFRRLVVEKGSMSVDGISLTIVDIGPAWFKASLVDYTLKHTTLGNKGPGDLVNLEFDIIAKYLSNMTKYAKSAKRQA